MRESLKQLVDKIKKMYPGETPVPLHAPRFYGNEKKYLSDCIDSTFVSYVGEYVSRFESEVATYTKMKHAIAMVNGTAALQMALASSGIKPGMEVITQSLTFVATANGITHAGGIPVFVDVDRDTMGMSPTSLEDFLSKNYIKKSDEVISKLSGKVLFGVMPMHTFGFPCRIDEIASICKNWGIALVEDAAESLGSWFRGKHTGSFGVASCLSFNGNKPVTTGGGGMMLTDSDEVAQRARYISTTAKRKHSWEFFHDELGWNLRMPNLNAAVGCAQLERMPIMLNEKRSTALEYMHWCDMHGIEFVREQENSVANYWLNAIILHDHDERDEFLAYANGAGVQTRPIWTLMHKLPMYETNIRSDMANSEWLEARVINLPSSAGKNL